MLEFTHDLPRDAQTAKCLKQIGQTFVNLPIGIQIPGAIGCPDEANRQGELQEPFASFVPASLMQAGASVKSSASESVPFTPSKRRSLGSRGS